MLGLFFRTHIFTHRRKCNVQIIFIVWQLIRRNKSTLKALCLTKILVEIRLKIGENTKPFLTRWRIAQNCWRDENARERKSAESEWLCSRKSQGPSEGSAHLNFWDRWNYANFKSWLNLIYQTIVVIIIQSPPTGIIYLRNMFRFKWNTWNTFHSHNVSSCEVEKVSQPPVEWR